jgi:phosphoribosylformylglycinamidine synthase PurS subunit
MMVRVYVTLKPSVLDPQGMTIQKALRTLGYPAAEEVRQGKYFEIQWTGDLALADERRKVEEIAAGVLSNPVIESYRIEWPAGNPAAPSDMDAPGRAEASR